MGKSSLRPISDKRKAEIKREKPIRELLLERSGGRCELCGSGLYVAAHEIIFRSGGGKLSVTNTIMLCQPCHNKAQARGIPAEKLLEIVEQANKRHGIKVE